MGAVLPQRMVINRADGASYGSESGFSPAFAIAGAASGDARKRISALAACGCCTGLGSGGAKDHADQRASELGCAVGAHQSPLAELVGGPSIQDHVVRGLASREPRGNRLWRVAHRWTARRDQAMTTCALESRAQLGINSMK